MMAHEDVQVSARELVVRPDDGVVAHPDPALRRIDEPVAALVDARQHVHARAWTPVPDVPLFGGDREPRRHVAEHRMGWILDADDSGREPRDVAPVVDAAE